jgi:hypothetical protein
MPLRRSVVPARVLATCLLAAIAISGCASSAPSHGSLTDREFNVAVAVARAEAAKDSTVAITSATATVGPGTVTDANDGPPCTSGTLLHIKLIGSFDIAVAGAPTANVPSTSAAPAPAPASTAPASTAPSDIGPSGGFPTDGGSYTVTAVLITADPVSGKACLLAVQITPVTPDPGSTLLFTN